MTTPRPKILLVDDREENLLALEALLGRAEAELLAARSGTAALELLLAHDVAVALIDVQMPEMDGFELAELMRGAERTRGVPIIFVTAGHHDQARVFQGYDSGAVDFLHKPIEPRVLRSKVGVFLQLHRQRQQLAATVRELREADRRKDEFLALLSHELRNPLMPIRNSLYVMQRAEPGSAQARHAEAVIDRQVNHLSRLIDDLLDVTRITRGKIQLQREAVDLCELARRTVEDHRAAFAAAGIALDVEVAPAPLTLLGDPTRIAQVVGNLLGNAVKFTAPGGTVQVQVVQRGDAAVLRVRDNGVGIAPDVIGHVFEPFAQADRSLARSRGGLGLGLALVKGVVELHGGTVVAASPGEGQGAVFEVVLPRGTSRADAPARPSAAAPRAARRLRVLVIEDNPDGAASLKDAIELMGHEVAVAHDGPSGLALARTAAPELVLCDIGLPGMDGYEVARRFRGDQQLRSATLVALTGYTLPEDQRRARDAGFTHHLAKPPEFDVLERLLAAAGGGSRGRETGSRGAGEPDWV